ncbi:hypothetical protein NSK_002694 [Nannochloropsis salina CCMP1776]|uniref:AB hydrolase-1 domain-containing protein n=1 Tax=Nannochloropsis salina CCMP1776 TaxID=1027361 RepID=A0A4D9D4C5_9STRA|nr:hypothetical protein NSK_002694 [Nannochloropsis salina CCMP1776]|eukprot:TFJ85874.1 hypothetical protein NSK_002694 [Nannochloropsis salina CCMP1776]
MSAPARLGYEIVSSGKPGVKKTVVFLPCAFDVRALLQSLDLQVDVLCGHSFGGKIALEVVKQGLEEKSRTGRSQGAIFTELPRQTWVFDSLPTPVDRHKAIGENSVWDVIVKLGQVPLPQRSKEKLVSFLITEKQIPPAIAHWLMTSLKNVPADSTHPASEIEGRPGSRGGYVWAFDLDVIRALFEAYTCACYYDVMSSPGLSLHDARIDFIRAGKNEAWTPDVLARFGALQAGGQGQVKLHCLEQAGHWIHVDDLEGVLRLLAPTFLPPL